MVLFLGYSKFYSSLNFILLLFIEKVPVPDIEGPKDEAQAPSKDQNKPAFIDEKANLMKDLETKIVVQV